MGLVVPDEYKKIQSGRDQSGKAALRGWRVSSLNKVKL